MNSPDWLAKHEVSHVIGGSRPDLRAPYRWIQVDAKPDPDPSNVTITSLLAEIAELRKIIKKQAAVMEKQGAEIERLKARKPSTWPEIMNTDQGCQYTSSAWTDALKDADVQISMDDKRRWVDNVMVERLWRSLKYEDICLHEYVDLVALGTAVLE